MGNGTLKHFEQIIQDVKILLKNQNGIITQSDIIKILKKYYSQSYSEQFGQRLITKELHNLNIATVIKIRLPFSTKSPTVQYIQIYVSNELQGEEKQNAITKFIRKNIGLNFIASNSNIQRSISNDLLRFEQNSDSLLSKTKKRQEIMEFPSMRFRAMLLHYVIINGFSYNENINVNDIIKKIPIGLALQIIRRIDLEKIHPRFELIENLGKDAFMELQILLPFLKLPYNPLIYDDKIQQKVVFQFQKYNIYKNFDFYNDKFSFTNYWILNFSIVNENICNYPLSLVSRFENYLIKMMGSLHLSKLPFFPRDIEKYSIKFGVDPGAVSFVVQKLFRKKLKIIHCSNEMFLEKKFFPISGLASFLILKSSVYNFLRPKFTKPINFKFNVDNSIRSLAKLFAASKISTQGYIYETRSNFHLFKEKVNQWISTCTKFSNLFSSFKENKSFNSLINDEMAFLIEEIKFPSLHNKRFGDKEIVKSQNYENDTLIKEKEHEKNEEEEESNEIVVKSNSMYFKAENSKRIDKILNCSRSTSVDNLNRNIDDLSKVYAHSFPQRNQKPIPNIPQEKLVSENESEIESNDYEFNLTDSYFEEEEEFIEYPEYSPENLQELKQSQFLQLFRFSYSIIHIPIIESIAIEFIKSILSFNNDDSQDLKLRQLIHFSDEEISNSLVYLNAINVLKTSYKLVFPKCKFDFINPYESEPSPQIIGFLDNNDAIQKLNWVGIDKIKKKTIESSSVFKVRQKITKDISSFSFERIRYEYPMFSHKIPLGNSTITDNYFLNDIDPLISNSFGKFEVENPQFTDFIPRYLFNLINSGGVNGIEFSKIINSFGYDMLQDDVDTIIDELQSLVNIKLICKVPTSHMEQRYTRFLSSNMLCKPIFNKIEMVNVHSWVRFDGFIDQTRKNDFRKNIISYIYSHEFCDFEELRIKFSYLSPNDLMILLNSLESDEVISVQCYLIDDSDSLFNEEVMIPTSFKSSDIFLSLNNAQINNPEINPKVKITYKTISVCNFINL